MPDPDLKRLRELRLRADLLLSTLVSDLAPFRHKLDKETFVRKPGSRSIDGDVNVTTTCSCVMALVLSNNFRKFYDVEKDIPNAKAKAHSIFSRLVAAPWMSSGLTADNPFSTTLVLRTYGFLKQDDLLDASAVPPKPWELNLGITDTDGLIAYLRSGADDLARVLYSSLSDETRRLLSEVNPSATTTVSEKKKSALTRKIGLDFRRYIQSGWIYSEALFDKVSDSTKSQLASWPTGYDLARANRGLLVEQLQPFFAGSSAKTLSQIAVEIAEHPGNFGINEYSTSATVLYWFVDALERGEISLEPRSWEGLCAWAAKEFNHERSLVLANHDAMMDPVAMAMAACLCAKLRSIAARAELGTEKAHRDMLPSMVELEHSILELFKRQAPSGIWPKYFPLFHYQDAGSNFCFTFEMLEAVLAEFGRTESSLLDQETILKGIEDAVAWCEKNSLKCSEDGLPYTGWNSGGDIELLEREHPESWATAVVHMFLWELSSVLSRRIQKRVLKKYGARSPKMPVAEFVEEIRKDVDWRKKNFGRALSALQDIDIFIDGGHKGLISILTEDFIPQHYPKTESDIRRNPTKTPLSALLFGPPGTSKTQITKAVAQDLGWPIVEINPSEFVKGSFQNVYLQAEEIFTDLMDLAAVVVLFDEMDALTQRRGPTGKDSGTSHLDTATQFLTTSMLPKLAALHDKGGVVFFMATNFQENFDGAIKRAGRFDFLLCMGPPVSHEKIRKLQCFFDPRPNPGQQAKAEAALERLLKGSKKHQIIFDLLTYGDCKSLFKRIGSEKDIGDNLENMTAAVFRKLLNEYSEHVSLKYSHVAALRRGPISLRSIDAIPDRQLRDLLERKSLRGTDFAQYIRDRRASKRQF